MNTHTAERCATLFAGLDRAHGVFEPEPEGDGRKVRGKARTVREAVTVQKWESHLAGRVGLGIAPLRDDGTVSFAAIDVDVYDLDHAALGRRITELNLPLNMCRSKSGGAHLYIFFREPAPAAEVRALLTGWVKSLGLKPETEIFPKHDSLANEDDFGNWINMPYFGGKRKALRPDVGELDLGQFLKMVEGSAVTFDFHNGPPCLQHLALCGFPHNLNNSLFSCGVYAKKRWPDAWEIQVEEYNNKYMGPGKPHEVQGIIDSLNKQEYNYMCSQQPIVSHCRKSVCLERRHGVGGGRVGVSVEKLEKLLTEPPTYYAVVNGKRIELESDDLLNQKRFAKLCMEQIDFVPTRVKEAVWLDTLNRLLKNVTVIPAPPEASDLAMFQHHLKAFCMDRAQARNRKEILAGKPWTENGNTYFRSQHLVEFLHQRSSQKMRPGTVFKTLKKLGGENRTLRIEGNETNVWCVPEQKDV